MGIGALLLALVNVGRIQLWRGTLRLEWKTVVVGGLCVSVYPLAFYTSMRVAGVAVGCVVSLASAPLASAVYERALEGRPLTARWTIACLCGIAGAALLCLPSNAQEHTSGTNETVAGVVLGLVAGVTYAGYARALRQLMSRGIPRGAATGAVFGLGAAVLIPLFLATAGGTLLATRSLAVIGYLALVPMFIGYVLFGYGLGRVDATTATTTTLIEPAVATLTAVAILGEVITGPGWFGMFLLGISLAVLLSETTDRCARRR